MAYDKLKEHLMNLQVEFVGVSYSAASYQAKADVTSITTHTSPDVEIDRIVRGTVADERAHQYWRSQLTSALKLG